MKSIRILALVALPMSGVCQDSRVSTSFLAPAEVPTPLELVSPINTMQRVDLDGSPLEADPLVEFTVRLDPPDDVQTQFLPAVGVTGRVTSYRGRFRASNKGREEEWMQSPLSQTQSATWEALEIGTIWENPAKSESKFLSSGIFYGGSSFRKDASTGSPELHPQFRHGVTRGSEAWENLGAPLADERPETFPKPSRTIRRPLQSVPYDTTFIPPTLTPKLFRWVVFGAGMPLDVPAWTAAQKGPLYVARPIQTEEGSRFEFVLNPDNSSTSQTMVVIFSDENPHHLTRFVSRKSDQSGAWSQASLHVEYRTSPSGLRYVCSTDFTQWSYDPSVDDRPTITLRSWKRFDDVVESAEFPSEMFRPQWASEDIPSIDK